MPSKLNYTKSLAVFFVCTENELSSGELEGSILSFLNKRPSSKYKFDLILFFNKIMEQEKVDKICHVTKGFSNINEIKIISLNFEESEDVFWYPWLRSPKPVKLPRLGYTSGANLLFYRSINSMINDEKSYENFLMLEADSYAISENWFDYVLDFSKKNDFTVAGSKYKGEQLCHYTSEYKDHLNGIAIYKNCKSLKKLIQKSENYVQNNLPEHGYINFDIANYLSAKNEKDIVLKDTDFIINISDPRDKNLSKEDIVKKYKKAKIIHQKGIKPLKLLNPNFCDTEYDKKMPVFFCNPHCGSEYTLSVIRSMVDKKAVESKKRSVVFRIQSEQGAVIKVFCLVGKFFRRYPNDFFIYQSGSEYHIEYYNFTKIIEEGSADIISVCLDFRYAKNFDQLCFSIFRHLMDKIKTTPIIYTFIKNPIDVKCTQFTQFIESRNKGGLEKSKRTLENLMFLADVKHINFFQKTFVGIDKSISEDFAKSHTLNCLEKFNIFNIKIIDKVLGLMFAKYHNCIINRLDAKNVSLNHTIGKISMHDSFIDGEVFKRIKKNLSFDYMIYDNYTINEVDMRKIPLFFVPLGGGLEYLKEFNEKYFLQEFIFQKTDKFGILQIPNDENSFTFIYLRIKKYEAFNLKVSKRLGKIYKGTFKTLEDALKEQEVEMMSVIIGHSPTLQGNNFYRILRLCRIYSCVAYPILPIRHCSARMDEEPDRKEEEFSIPKSLGLDENKNALDHTLDFFIKNNFQIIQSNNLEKQLKAIFKSIFNLDAKVVTKEPQPSLTGKITKKNTKLEQEDELFELLKL